MDEFASGGRRTQRKGRAVFCTRASAGAKGRMTAARTGGAGVWPGVIRVTFWGALAMGMTAAVGLCSEQ